MANSFRNTGSVRIDWGPVGIGVAVALAGAAMISETKADLWGSLLIAAGLLFVTVAVGLSVFFHREESPPASSVVSHNQRGGQTAQIINNFGSAKGDPSTAVEAARPALVLGEPVSFPTEHIGQPDLTSTEGKNVGVELWRVSAANTQDDTLARNVRAVLAWSNPAIPTLPVDLHVMHDNVAPYRRMHDLRGGEPPLFVDVLAKETTTAVPIGLYLYRSDLQQGYTYELSDQEALPLLNALSRGWHALIQVELVPDPPARKAVQLYRLRLAVERNLESRLIMEPFDAEGRDLRPDRQRARLRANLEEYRSRYYRDAESFSDEPGYAVGWLGAVEGLFESALGTAQPVDLEPDELVGSYHEILFRRLQGTLEHLDEIPIRPDW